MTTDIKTKDDTDHLAGCMFAICDPQIASNPVAWFDLEQAGMTREDMKARADAGDWLGPAPLFDLAPDRDGKMWKHLQAQAGA